jgi:hypothetical protein
MRFLSRFDVVTQVFRHFYVSPQSGVCTTAVLPIFQRSHRIKTKHGMMTDGIEAAERDFVSIPVPALFPRSVCGQGFVDVV